MLTQGRWSDDLPGDLLGAIYRCCSSSYDHGRFAAVCTSWRAAASWQPALPLPLLLPSTRNGLFDRKALPYSPEDGRVLRAPLPCFPYGKRIVGSYDGGWVAGAIGCRINVVNLFTGACVLCKRDIMFWRGKFSTQKIIFSKDPASIGCIVAAMSTSCVALFSLGGPGGDPVHIGFCMLYVSEDLVDIAFCNGELYVLSSYSYGDIVLYKRGIGLDKDNDCPAVISREKINIRRPAKFRPRYIFDLDGKLAIAGEVGPVTGGQARTFRVFEVVRSCDTIESYELAEVASLGDHALFLGSGSCKAVQMSSAMCGKVERNCIYYSEKEEEAEPECFARLDLGSCAVYCYESKGGDPSKEITSRGYHYPEKGHYINDRNTCTWIFPPHF